MRHGQASEGIWCMSGILCEVNSWFPQIFHNHKCIWHCQAGHGCGCEVIIEVSAALFGALINMCHCHAGQTFDVKCL